MLFKGFGFHSDIRRDGITQFMNCRILRNHQLVVEDLWTEAGKILDPEKVFFDQKCRAETVVDCGNNIIAPGLIELQINGGFGIDFSSDVDNMADQVDNVAKKLLKYGVTSFCPTVISSSREFYSKVLSQFRVREGSSVGAGILGLHLEGPFINKERRGAHPLGNIASSLQNGASDLFAMYGTNLDNVRMITLAPELPGAVSVVKFLTERGIKVSIGHSCANFSEGEAAMESGATMITHLFNAMLPFHHRDPGIVGLLTSMKLNKSNRRLFYGIIGDSIHTHDAALRIAYRTDPHGLILVSDAVPALGLGDGKHNFGDTVVEIKGLRAAIHGKEDTLAGSVCPLNICVNNFRKAARCSTVEALECATLHPAEFLGIQNKKGTLTFGADADFILIDEDTMNVNATFIDGLPVWVKTDL